MLNNQSQSNDQLSEILKTEKQIMLSIPDQSLAIVCEAGRLTANHFNNLVKNWQSIPYLLLTRDQINRLKIPIVGINSNGWLMTETIEAGSGITTGISAMDRTTTILKAIDPKSSPQDIMMPGHILVALLDDCDSKPATYLYNHLSPHQRPLLWFPVLSDSLNCVDKSQGKVLAQKLNIRYVML